MATHRARRRYTAFAGGLAVLAFILGFMTSPANAAPPPPVTYVALGDSYTAGTGSGGLYRPPVACWQSHPGYVDDVAATGRVTLLANLACHGAVLSPASPFYDGVTPTVLEQVLGGQPALQNAGLVSVTAGAIDAGSLLILAACSAPGPVSCADTVAAVAANLPSLQAGLVSTYQAIQAAAPNARIAVMGYPRLFDPVNGVPVLPPSNQLLVNQAVDALNATIKAAVLASGTNAQFVDVTSRFIGHAANSGAESWIVLEFLSPLPDANFHPNVAGHLNGYASALISAIKPAKLAKQ
ncbi:SGNH/GDSL hydrolase family protein [Paenarthrobacter sp. NPDC092416]|uniref:SGNH/GDSL hydrolase family protein n=1 Tax=Paenarthrobacter sp. NPDC092416 TaxID=3364386 RepID=UPI00382D77BF